MKGKKTKAEKPEEQAKPKDDRTTIRAKVAPDEHDAVRWFSKHKCNTTIEDFVRQAVDAYLVKLAGKGLATLAEENRSRGKLVQEELF